eukprot:15213911-Heterocapsa_arctica.AAC.1
MEVAAYEAQPSWKKDGYDNKWNQGMVPESSLHQEGTPPGSGPEWRSTEPQWEPNHDQKKGVRIGESKVPAQHDHIPAKGKSWTSLSANITSWSTAGLEWAAHEDDN